jgi:hypothetical protein
MPMWSIRKDQLKTAWTFEERVSGLVYGKEENNRLI